MRQRCHASVSLMAPRCRHIRLMPLSILTRDLFCNRHSHGVMLRPVVIARVEEVELVVPLNQAGRLQAGLMSIRTQVAQVGSSGTGLTSNRCRTPQRTRQAFPRWAQDRR